MAAAGMEQAMIQLQTDLAQTRSQMQMMAASHDNLQRAHEALKGQSDALFRQRAEEIKASEDKLSRLLFSQKFDLLDMQAMQPEMFKGRRNDAFKPWARKLKAYCNAKRQGFRKALEWAESQSARSPISRACSGSTPSLRTPSFMISFS